MDSSVDSTFSSYVVRWIQLTASTIGSAALQYDVVKGDTTLREAFHEAGRSLQLVQQALQESQSELPGATQKALDLIRKCNEKAEISKSLFLAVADASAGARQEAYAEAVQKRSNGETVEALAIGIATDVCELAETLAIQSHIDELRAAIDRLNNAESSLPKAKPDGVFNHYGAGNQYNAPGGVQNISKGAGNHFPGATFSNPVYFGVRSSRKQDMDMDTDDE
ncbi:hypothetical protein ACHAPT_013247 [Fusarium lateritium]